MFGKVKIASLIENKKKKFAIKSIPREILEKHIDKNEDDSEEFDVE